MRVRRFNDPSRFRERAGAWLQRHEAEHGLLLGLLAEILDGSDRFDDPLYFATMEDAGAVVGCAFRTPPYKLGLTRMPITALPALVVDLGECYTELPAVMGPAAPALEFGKLWSARTGCTSRRGRCYRLHATERVTPPERPAQGALRLALPAELALLTSWGEEFNHDTGIHDQDPARLTSWLIDENAAYVWDAGGPRSMLAAMEGAGTGVRIAYVYTPPEFRGRGYATTAVAELTQRQLDRGRRYCCLFTDLANPTSNAIYARIGYRPVSDVLDVRFD